MRCPPQTGYWAGVGTPTAQGVGGVRPGPPPTGGGGGGGGPPGGGGGGVRGGGGGGSGGGGGGPPPGPQRGGVGGGLGVVGRQQPGRKYQRRDRGPQPARDGTPPHRRHPAPLRPVAGAL